MTRVAVMGGERRELVTPIGLRLIDGFTGKDPIGRVGVVVDREEPAGVWTELTDVKPVRSASGIIACPQLDRVADVAAAPARRYRLRVTAEFYRPFYDPMKNGVEFDGFAYSDENVPAGYAQQVAQLILLPSPAYPFPAHVAVLRGVVKFGSTPVADAVISEGGRETALADERGEFALPLRWVAPNAATPIDAEDRWTGRTGTIVILIPMALGVNQTITIT